MIDKTKRVGKYVLRPILPGATHIYICPKGCERRPENKIYSKVSRRKKGFVLDWYCPSCNSKLNMVKVTGKMRKGHIVRVFAGDYDKKKGVKKEWNATVKKES